MHICNKKSKKEPEPKAVKQKEHFNPLYRYNMLIQPAKSKDNRTSLQKHDSVGSLDNILRKMCIRDRGTETDHDAAYAGNGDQHQQPAFRQRAASVGEIGAPQQQADAQTADPQRQMIGVRRDDHQDAEQQSVGEGFVHFMLSAFTPTLTLPLKGEGT